MLRYAQNRIQTVFLYSDDHDDDDDINRKGRKLREVATVSEEKSILCQMISLPIIPY